MAITLPAFGEPVAVNERLAVPDLTQGISQSSTAPAAIGNGFGDRPWDEEEAANQTALNEWYRESVKKLDAATLDPDTFFKGEDFGWGDPEEAKREVIVDSWLELHTDQPIPTDPLQRRILIQETSLKMFDEMADDDATAFDLIKGDAVKRKDENALFSAIAAFAMDEAALPIENRTGIKGMMEKVKAMPGYKPEMEPDYVEKLAQASREMDARIEPFKDTLNMVWLSAVNKAAIPREMLTEITDEDWPEFLKALRLRAETLPDTEKETFLAGMRKDFMASLESYGRQAGEAVQDYAINSPGFGFEPGDFVSPGVSEKTRKQAESARNRASEVRQILTTKYDVIDYVDGLGWLQKAPGVTVTSLSMAIPVAGPATMAMSMQGAAQEDMYLKLRGQGLSEENAGNFSGAMAPAIMVPQMVLENVGFGILSRKLPGVSAALDAVGDRIKNRALRFATKTAAITAAEGTVEVTQDFTQSVVQDIAHEIQPLVPDVDLGKEFAGAWAQFPEIAGSMIILSMFGAAGGLSRESQLAAFAESTPRQMRALGILEADIISIENAKAKGPASLGTAIDAAFTNPERNANSPEAAQAAQEEAEAIKVEIAALQAAQKAGVVPSFTRTDAGWTVTDTETGEELGTSPNVEGAMKIAASHASMIQEDNANQTAFLATLLQATEAATPKGSTTTVSPFQKVTAAQQASLSKADETRVMAQAKAREAIGGDTSMSDLVFGSSTTEFKQRARSTANRINAGGSVLTVFHEEAHGFFREALRSGRLTKDETVAVIRAIEQVFSKTNADGTVSQKTTKDGQSLKFLPDTFDGMTDQEIDTAIDEAISELMEAEIIRTRKSGRAPAGVISKNLSAMAKLGNPKAIKKFKAFVDAVRDFFGLAMSRAYAIKQGIKEGKIKEADLQAFTAKLFGLDTQDQHEAAVVEEIKGMTILGEKMRTSLSMGRATVTPTTETRTFEGTNGETVIGPAAFSIGAWHASPHKVNSFSKMHMGTGEGAQAYGYGFYFAESEAISGPDGYYFNQFKRTHGQANAYRVSLNVNESDLLDWDAMVPAKLAKKLEKLALFKPLDYPGYRSFSITAEDLQKMTGADLHQLIGERLKIQSGYGHKADVAIYLKERKLKGIKYLDGMSRASGGSFNYVIFDGADIEILEENGQPVNKSFSLGPARMADAASMSLREFSSKESADTGFFLEFMPRQRDKLAFVEALAKIKRRKMEPLDVMLEKHDKEFMGDSASGHPQLFKALVNAGLLRDSENATAETSGSSFQMGPAKMADALIANARKRMTDPRARMRIFGNVIDRLNKLQALVNATGNAYNFDAFGKPFEGQFSAEKGGILNALAILDAILAAVPPDLRGRVGGYTQLAKLDTDEKRLDYLKRRMKTVDRVINEWLGREYTRLLDQLLERSKPAKDQAGKKKVGKAGADIHDLFDTLRQAKNWNQSEVDSHITGWEAEIAKGEMTPDEEAHTTIMIGLVGLVGNWRDADTARRATAVQEATSVFEAGYAKFKLAKLFEKEDREIRRKNLRADTGKQGLAPERDRRTLADNGLKAGWRDSFLSLISFEQLSEYLFGRNSAEALRLVDMEREASAKKEDGTQAKMDALDELFTNLGKGSQLEGEKIRFVLAQKTLTIQGRTLSPLEAITATLMWRQEDGRRHMMGHQDGNGQYTGPWHYDQSFVDDCEAALSLEAKAVRDFLAAAYGAEWAALNPVYKALNGINLPQNPNYSPLTVKPQQASAGQMVDPVTGSTMSGASTTPGSLRTRGTSIAEPDFRDALQTYIAHTKQMQHWMAYAPFMQEAGAILRNRELGNSIEEKGGKEALRLLRSWLDFFQMGGVRDAAAHLAINQTLNRVSGRVASSILIGRMGVLAIQTTQLAAGLAEMPVGSFAMRFGKLLTGNLQWGAAFRSEYIQRRLNQMPVVVQQAMEGLKASKPNRLKYHVQQLGRLIAGTDALMTAGTFAIIHDYQLKQAKSLGLSGADADAYAMQAAERAVDRIAQPTRPGARSLYENVSSNPSMRVLWAFASESRQKIALALWRLGSKDRSLGEKARAMAVTWVVGGMVASIIRAAMRDVRSDDDDEVFDDRNWSPKRLLLSSLTGPLQGIPFLGDALEAGVYNLAGEYQQESNLFSSLPKAFKSATRVTDWGDKKPDEIMKDIEAILSGAAFFNDSLSAASSLSHLARDLFGIADNIVPD